MADNRKTPSFGPLGSFHIPIRQLIPNAVTVLALCAGLTGMRFAIAGKWEVACMMVVLAGFLDGIDGRIARYLKGTSRFGAELDSLADVIAFGVAPAVIMYSWVLHDLRGYGWVVALSHTVCCALRLARFNTQLDTTTNPHKQHGFNTGVPSPSGAGLTLTPLMAWIWLGPIDSAVPPGHLIAVLTAIWVGSIAFLMVAPLATYSWKSFRLRKQYRLPALLGIALFAGLLLNEMMGTLCIVSATYIVSLFFSQRSFLRKWRKSMQAGAPQSETGPLPPGQ